MELEGPGTADVPHEVVGAYFQRRIVAELLRIAYLGRELLELRKGSLSGGLGHPGKVGEPLSEYLAQVIHKYSRPSPGFFWEVLLHILFPKRLSDHPVYCLDGPLPSRFLFDLPLDLPLEEIEIFQFDLLMKKRGEGSDQLPVQVGLPFAQAALVHQRRKRIEELRLPYYHVGRILDSDPFQVRRRSEAPVSRLQR